MNPVMKWLARIGAVAVVGAVVLALGYRAYYEDWPWKGAKTLTVCNGTYERTAGPAKTRKALRTAQLFPVYRVPPLVGEVVYSPGPGERRGRAVPPCGEAIYTRAGDRRYTAYALKRRTPAAKKAPATKKAPAAKKAADTR